MKHAFQDPAGGKRVCLACATELPSAGDVVFAILRPSEESQSTVLSGLDPNVILECASKALRFWNYQMSTEMYYKSRAYHKTLLIVPCSAWQEHLSKEWTNRYSSLHKNARKVVDDANTEIADLQRQVECESSSYQSPNKKC